MKASSLNEGLVGRDGKLTPFAEHMLALGRLCVAWAYLDHQTIDAVSLLLDGPTEQATCVTTEARDMSARCRMMKTLAFAGSPLSNGEMRLHA